MEKKDFFAIISTTDNYNHHIFLKDESKETLLNRFKEYLEDEMFICIQDKIILTKHIVSVEISEEK